MFRAVRLPLALPFCRLPGRHQGLALPVATPGGFAPGALRRRPPPRAPPLRRPFSETTRASAASAVFTLATGATTTATASSTAHSIFSALAGAITGTISALLTPRGLIAAAAAGVVFGLFRFSPRSRPVERAYAKEVIATLGKVATPAPFAPEDVLLARPRAAAELATALDSGAPPGFFLLVTGPPGVGKTTLVRLALRELAARREDEQKKGDDLAPPPSPDSALPGGAAYVAAAAHPLSNFGRELASAIGFSFEEGVRTLDLVYRLFVSSAPIQDTAKTTESLARAASALEEAALELKAGGRGGPLIVIDAADRLAQRDPDALLDMLEYAKGWAESGLATVAFVAGDPTTLNLMRASPAFSRAAPPIVVEGPTRREAVEFLNRRLKVRGAAALPADLSALAAIVHDDWLLLEKAAALLVAGAAAVDLTARFVADAESRFVEAGLLDRTPHQAAGLALAHALADLPEDFGSASVLPPADWHRLCPDRAAQDALLLPKAKGGRAGGSPFRYEPGVGLTFASAVDAAFVRSGLLDKIAFKGCAAGGGGGGGDAAAAATSAGEGAGVEEVE